MSQISPRTTWVAVPVTALLSLALAGCGPVGATGADGRVGARVSASQAPLASTPEARVTSGATAAPEAQPTVDASAASTPRPSPTAVGTGTGGPGSLTLSVSEPVQVSGHVSAPVTCSVGRSYRASMSGTVQGYLTTASVTATPYRGAGQYTALVAMSLTAPDGTAYVVPAIPLTATLSDTGGSVHVSAVTIRGQTVEAALAWACSTAA